MEGQIIKIISNIKPIVWNIFSTLGSTGLPLIFSIITNITLPPSNAGKGKILINPNKSVRKDKVNFTKIFGSLKTGKEERNE